MVYLQTAPPKPMPRAQKRVSSKIEMLKPPTRTSKPKRARKPLATLTVKCSHCFSLFEARRKTAKFCNSNCRINAHRQTKRDAKLGNGRQCIRCCKPLTGRQRKYCGNSCTVLTHRAKKRDAIHTYQTMGMPLDTILETFERVGFTTASQALQAMGYNYSYDRKQWLVG